MAAGHHGSVTLGEEWRLGHRPALDGIRGVAVLLVVAAHAGIYAMNSTSTGSAGVTVFFTLSGFLITALLLEERARSGRVRLGAFYARRARRLLPALLGLLAFVAALELVMFGRVTDGELLAGALTYSANFLMLDGRWGEPTLLGHMWSLSIEEQFYLVWPIALLVLARWSPVRAVAVLAYAVLGSVALRALLWDDGAGHLRLWMGPDTRADALLIGCALAMLLHGRPRRLAPHGWAATGGVVLLLLTPWQFNFNAQVTAVMTPLIASLATAGLIYGTDSESGRLLASRTLGYVGSRSYGLYLYHVPCIVAAHHLVREGMLVAWMVGVPASFAMAELSWRFVEQPAMRAWKIGRADRGAASRLPAVSRS